MARVPVKNLKRICNPFEHCVWDIPKPVTIDEVSMVLATGAMAADYDEDLHDKSSIDHAQRIAYFVHNGWQDPIVIDVGVPTLGFNPDWIIWDGNHRLAAAIYRGDKFIEAEIGGDVDYAAQLLGLAVDEVTAAVNLRSSPKTRETISVSKT